jgi:hypothetical protein
MTNSPDIVAAADEVWESLAQCFATPPVELRFAVALDNISPRPNPMMPTGQGHLMSIVHSADNFAIADFSRGFTFGWLTPAVTNDAGYFRYHFLEPLSYTMLSSLYLTPVHAACVALNGKGVLLCGDSGAGKTSLAYGCARRGWTYLADDATHLVRDEPGRRLLGWPHQIRFRASAKTLFPELQGQPEARRANGKLDIEAHTADLGFSSIASETRADFLIFLDRGNEDGARLEPMLPEWAFERLARVICFGEERVRKLQRESLRSLVDVPVFELVYRDLDDAEMRLRRLVETGR